MMKVLGVSGSPIKNSNTDRALKAVLDATGLETEFVKLTDYTIAPCKACLGCVKTNKCVIDDDGILMAQKAKEAGMTIDLKGSLSAAGFEYNVSGATVEVTLESVVESISELVSPHLAKVIDAAVGDLRSLADETETEGPTGEAE